VGQTKLDAVDYARAIVHGCLAREFGESSCPAREAQWSPRSVVLLIAALLPSVAFVAWLLTR
jgi:hypothetical protein